MAVCSTDTSGAWHMLPTDDEVAGRRRCAKRCTRCRNCRFVSYSRQDNDCSWYADCRLGGLRDSPSGHHSAQVKRVISGELARQRQSRPQPPHAPPTALMIYHIAKTGGIRPWEACSMAAAGKLAGTSSGSRGSDSHCRSCCPTASSAVSLPSSQRSSPSTTTRNIQASSPSTRPGSALPLGSVAAIPSAAGLCGSGTPSPLSSTRA